MTQISYGQPADDASRLARVVQRRLQSLATVTVTLLNSEIGFIQVTHCHCKQALVTVTVISRCDGTSSSECPGPGRPSTASHGDPAPSRRRGHGE